MFIHHRRRRKRSFKSIRHRTETGRLLFESLEDRRPLAAFAELSGIYAAASITRQGNTVTEISDLAVGDDVYTITFSGKVPFNTQFGSDAVPANPPLYFGDATKARAISNAITAVLVADRTLSSLGASAGDSDASTLLPASATATTHGGFDIAYEGQGSWGGGASYASISRTSAHVFTLVALANEPPTVTLSLNNATIPEAAAIAELTATLSAASSDPVTVELGFTGTATNVADYTRSGTQIAIAAGSTTGTVRVTAVPDTLAETDETVIVDITGVTNATESATQQQTITIIDDDPSATVAGTVLNGGLVSRSGLASLMLQFSEPVTVSGPDSLHLWNHTTSAAVSISGATLAGNGTGAITWNLSGVTLPDGYYTATFPKAEGLAATHSTLFSILGGDSSGNAQVDFSDFGVLANAFNTVGGPIYGPGDMNGDGNVDFGDFGILANGFNNVLALPEMDFGDAGGSFPTSLPNGARHILGSGLSLGASVDGELDGQPDANATGDGADENGVTFSALQAGSNANITVTATVPGTAMLNAWLDFNRDGDWDDGGEQVFVDQALTNGPNSLTAAIPSAASAGLTFARFRVSSGAGHAYFGLASDGEVEDYQVTLVAAKSSASRLGPVAGSTLTVAAFVARPSSPQITSLSPHRLDSVWAAVKPTATAVVDLAIAPTAATEPRPPEAAEDSSALDADLVDQVFKEETASLTLGIL